jgi:hypothetical protein
MFCAIIVEKVGNMAKPRKGVVVVTKEWINTGVRHLINHGNESRSTGDTHVIFADLDDTTDQRGLWLKNVHTDRLTTDGARVTMQFMIPWSAVVGLGVVDDGAQTALGFAPGTKFEPADLTDQSTAT